MVFQAKLAPYSTRFGLDKYVYASEDWDFRNMFAGTKIIKKYGKLAVRSVPGESAVLFFGDSNIEQYSPRVIPLALRTKGKRGVFFIAYGGCRPVPGHDRGVGYPSAEMFEAFWDCLGENPNIDTVVIGASWFPMRFSNTETVDGFPINSSEGWMALKKNFEKFVQDINDRGKKVVIISNIPFDKQLDPKNLIQRTLFPPSITILKDEYIVRESLLKINNEMFVFLKNTAEQNDAFFIDPTLFLCPNGKCRAVDIANNKIIYKDINHLTNSYVRNYITFLDDVILNTIPAAHLTSK
jgi:hypothetical protein